ncbi:MAG: transcriptional regulator [Mesorhizobium sp.]|nr:MAG: transcriptional regulator [Mesorhizobium sp.]
MVAPPFVFGPFVFAPALGELLRDGKPIALGQKGAALLEALLKAEGGVVSRQELMDSVWPGMAVEEGNLSVQIAALRKLLGVDPDGREWIATVPRIGYRMVTSRRGEDMVALPAQPALAALPFENLGGDSEQDWFADGVVDDIITALSRFKSFAVIARNSSFVYKGRPVDVRQVAKELDVRYVLQGSVRRSGDRLRITAQLIQGSTGAHLWAQNLDGALDNVFDFQDRITEAVATVVGPEIEWAEIERSRRERPGSIAAYEVYLQARAKILSESKRGNAEAYALLTQGLALEPDNPQFLAHAAWALEHRITMGWPPFGPDDRQRCADFARRGLEHAAGDAIVMTHCAMALLQVVRDYDWGMAVLQSAVDANPNYLTVVTSAGVGHLHCGSVEDALACFHRANRLMPRDQIAHIALCGIAHAHVILGNYEEALASASRALARNPNFDATLWMLAAASAYLGRMDEARRFVEALSKLSPGVTIATIRAGQPAMIPERIGVVLEGLRLAGLEEG